jgi:hypothetical protein
MKASRSRISERVIVSARGKDAKDFVDGGKDAKDFVDGILSLERFQRASFRNFFTSIVPVKKAQSFLSAWPSTDFRNLAVKILAKMDSHF